MLKGSALWEAMLAAYHAGGVLAASGAGATLVCDPMVDPRGGAYTVGLGVIADLAVFPYHGTAADHLRERSIDLLPRTARLVGIDEETALVRDPDGRWRVAGVGSVTVYQGRVPSSTSPATPSPASLTRPAPPSTRWVGEFGNRFGRSRASAAGSEGSARRRDDLLRRDGDRLHHDGLRRRAVTARRRELLDALGDVEARVTVPSTA